MAEWDPDNPPWKAWFGDDWKTPPPTRPPTAEEEAAQRELDASDVVPENIVVEPPLQPFFTPEQRLAQLREWIAKGWVHKGQMENVEAVIGDLTEGRTPALWYQKGVALPADRFGMPDLRDGPCWREGNGCVGMF